MPTITIAFEELEEDRRRRSIRRRLPIIAAAALGAMVLLATDEERKPIVVTVVKPVRFNVLVPQPVEVPVATEVHGPPKPVFVPVPAPSPTPTLPPAPPPAPAALPPAATPAVIARVPLSPAIEPRHVHFSSSHWQRVAITNPHPEPLQILSIIPTGLNGAAVRGYNVDSRHCVGTLDPGQTCHVTVFARKLGLVTREAIEIRVNVAAP
jgi:hypothetical protein